jgi:hypothetical protein
MTQLVRALATRRGMNTMVFGLPAAVLAALAVVIGMQGAGDGGGGGGDAPPVVVPDAALVAASAGCTPEALAMANCDADDAASIFLMLKQLEAAAELSSAETALSSLAVQRSALEAQARRFGASAELKSVRQQHASALSSRDALRADVRAAIAEEAAGLTGVDEVALASAMANAHRDVDLKYRVLSLDEASWSKLEHALSQPSAEMVSEDGKVVLDAANGNVTVAAAELKLADAFALSALKAAFQAEAAQ